MQHHDHDVENLRADDRHMGLRFGFSIGLNLSFVAAEVAFGLISDSMALLTDAAHNMSDVLGLVLAWWASYLALKRPTKRRTYGYQKATILAALANATLVLVAVGAIAWEAALRLSSPPAVRGDIVMLVAGIGVVVNSVSALLFLKGRKRDVNLGAAFAHLAADAAISLGVVAAGLLIAWTSIAWIDPVVSLAVSAVIVAGTWSVLKKSLDLAMDAVPSHIVLKDVESLILRHQGVRSIHDLHVWALSSTENALSAHIVTDGPWATEHLRALCCELKQSFGLEHATIQVEPADGCDEPCPLDRDGAL